MSSATQLRPAVDPVRLASLYPDDQAKVLSPAAASALICGITVDSADVEEGWVFVAVPGEKRHGVSFAGAAVERGARVVVTDHSGAKQAQDLTVPVVVVDDPRWEAARLSASLYSPYFNKLVLIAVTGTNGKTTTTYLVRGALEPKFRDVALMGTLEIAVGPPGAEPLLSERTTAEAPVVYRALALAAQNGYRAAVVEASSHALSLHRIAGLVFDSVIFTNLQHDHLDFYGDMDRYFAAKAELFDERYAKRGVVSVDDKWGQKLAREGRIPVETVSALESPPAELLGTEHHWVAADLQEGPGRWGVSFSLTDPHGTSHDCFCPIPGRVNVQNSALAIIAATQVGVRLADSIAGLAKTTPPPGRMERLPRAPGKPSVLIDYAHTPEALEAALETLRPLVRGRLILVFGTDGDRDASKREPLAAVAARLGDELWITDENPRTEDPQQVRDFLLRGAESVRPGLEGVIEVRTSRRDAIRRAILSASAEDLVAILGKGAETYQEIEGIRHAHLDAQVASEVLRDMPTE